MDKIERQIGEIRAVLNVIREKRKQLKERIQKGDADREVLEKLREEDKIIDLVQRRGRSALSVLKIKDPEIRKKIFATGLMDENPQPLIKELKRFVKQISKDDFTN